MNDTPGDCSGDAAAGYSTPDRPDWSRLSIVPVRSEQALVIDRENGKWGYVPASSVSLLQLLNVEASRLPDGTRKQRDVLASDLVDLGLGWGEYATPSDLTTVILKLTKACNYACAYCYDVEPDDRIEHLSLAVVTKVMKEALELAPERLGIILHGGEPLLVYETLLTEIVLQGERIAEELGKKVSFSGQTNLYRLSEDMVRFFDEHNVSWGISLDGPPELNDKFRVLRNGEGTYKYFLATLEEHPEYVKNKCGILSTITSANDRHLRRIAEHFRDLGMKSWNWSLFQPTGQGRGKEGIFDFSIERLLDSWNDLFDGVTDGAFDGVLIGPVWLYLRSFLCGSTDNMCMRRDCGAARDLLSISPDGSIEACDCIDPRSPYAKLAQLRVEEDDVLQNARASEKATLIRSRDVTVGLCGTCPWLALCGGTCLAYAKDLSSIWDDQCRISMEAYSRIATSFAESGALRRYWDSVHPIHTIRGS